MKGMKGASARQRVHRARIELEAAERKLDASWQPWHERLRQHRVALLIGSGLLGGFAIATVAPKRWARLGALVFGGGAWLTRSALMPTLLGALWPRMRNASGVREAHGAARGNGESEIRSE